MPRSYFYVLETGMEQEIFDYVRANGGRMFLTIAVIALLRVLYSIGKTRVRLYRVRKQGLVRFSKSRLMKSENNRKY